jgi:hypothetical protein
MTRVHTPVLLKDAVGLLVHHFGPERVQTALAAFSRTEVDAARVEANVAPNRPIGRRPISVASALEKIRHLDEQKYTIAAAFHRQLLEKTVLPESQDIRQFAQIIGLKGIKGKSRRDLIPPLMRFLIAEPLERLRVALAKAPGVSEQQRQRGFSILTDKLLSDK